VTGVPGDFGNHAQIDESQAHGADKVVFGSVVEVVVRRYCQDLWIEASDGLTCRSACDAPPQRPPVVRSLRPVLQLGAQRRTGGVRPANR